MLFLDHWCLNPLSKGKGAPRPRGQPGKASLSYKIGFDATLDINLVLIGNLEFNTFPITLPKFSFEQLNSNNIAPAFTLVIQ